MQQVLPRRVEIHPSNYHWFYIINILEEVAQTRNPNPFCHLNKFIKTILIGHNEKLESIYKVPLQSSISDINHSWRSSKSLFCNCIEKVHHETFFEIVWAVVDSITFTKNIEFINRKTNNKAKCTLDFLKF